MTEQHKLGRINAIRACFNSKSTAWLTKKFEVKQAHNKTGNAFLERFEYSKDKVTTYDVAGKEIKVTGRAKKVQNISKLPKATDGKLRKSTEQ